MCINKENINIREVKKRHKIRKYPFRINVCMTEAQFNHVTQGGNNGVDFVRDLINKSIMEKELSE